MTQKIMYLDDLAKYIGKSVRLCCRVKVPAFLTRKVEEIPLVPWLYPGLNIDDVKAGLCGCNRFKE